MSAITRGARRCARALIGAAALAVVSAELTANAQPARPSEYQVKAAYLFNFARFVTWPPAPATQENTIAICVVGADPFGESLESAGQGLSIDGRRPIVRRVVPADAAADCNVVFIAAAENQRLEPIIAAVGKPGVLTVSDAPDFSKRGGMIQFVVDGSRIRFEVNLTAAEQAGLMLSSELLKVAVTVRRAARPGA